MMHYSSEVFSSLMKMVKIMPEMTMKRSRWKDGTNTGIVTYLGVDHEIVIRPIKTKEGK